MNMANGYAEASVQMQDSLYYEILSEMTGTDIRSEYQLISIVKEMSQLKKEYEAVSDAMRSVKEHGYGVIVPQREEIKMEDPVIIRQGNRYGVKIRAASPSVHLIRAEVETEIAPIVGSESQAEDLISYIKNSGQDENGGWNTLIFGKSVEQMIEEGIRTRVLSIGDESQQKLQDAMKKIVNKSHGRLLFFII